MDETINFSEKIAPFLNPDLMLQKEALVCLNETRIDRYNCHVLNKFLHEYGAQELEVNSSQHGGVTTINSELEREAPELIESAIEATGSLLT